MVVSSGSGVNAFLQLERKPLRNQTDLLEGCQDSVDTKSQRGESASRGMTPGRVHGCARGREEEGTGRAHPVGMDAERLFPDRKSVV